MATLAGAPVSSARELDTLRHKHAMLSKESAEIRDALTCLLRDECMRVEEQLREMQMTIEELQRHRSQDQDVPSGGVSLADYDHDHDMTAKQCGATYRG